jgi:biotin carboxyl carrier protein
VLGILKVAYKLLVNDKGKFAAVLMGITFSVFLMIQMTSMLAGLSWCRASPRSRLRADIRQQTAALVQAAANDRTAGFERDHSTKLFQAGAVSASDYDNRLDTAAATAAAADVSRQSLAAAKAREDESVAKVEAARVHLEEVKTNAPRQLASHRATVAVRRANVDLARAQLAQAELNRSYAAVLAPVAGIIGKKPVNVGDRVSPGQELMALSDMSDLWVTANFRETQLEQIHVGHPIRGLTGTLRLYSDRRAPSPRPPRPLLPRPTYGRRVRSRCRPPQTTRGARRSASRLWHRAIVWDGRTVSGRLASPAGSPCMRSCIETEDRYPRRERSKLPRSPKSLAETLESRSTSPYRRTGEEARDRTCVRRARRRGTRQPTRRVDAVSECDAGALAGWVGHAVGGRIARDVRRLDLGVVGRDGGVKGERTRVTAANLGRVLACGDAAASSEPGPSAPASTHPD